jgi:hypothetical protein
MCDVAKMKLQKKCGTPLEPIIVFIQLRDKDETIGLCRKCWGKVADMDWWEVVDTVEITELPLEYKKEEIEEILKEEIPEEKKAEEDEYVSVAKNAWARKDAMKKKIDIKELMKEGEKSLREETQKTYSKRGKHKKRNKQRKDDVWSQDPEDY